MKTLEQDNLSEVLNQNSLVLVQYGASWCGACRLLKPKLTELASAHKDVLFLYVDAENNPHSRELVNLENLPTIATFKEGKLVKQITGTNMEKIQGALDEITSH